MPLPNEQEIKALMNKVDIPCVAVASISHGDISKPTVLLKDGNEKSSKIQEPIFRAASLSKPVFAYLVYKLAMDKNIDFDLDTPLHEILEDERFSGDDASKKLTAKLVLSHQSGLPIFAADSDLALDFQFEPGEGYGYSGVAYSYLQKVIEKVTGSDLESLAQQYVFKDLMPNSTFEPDGQPQKAENSLQTTATDYARFIAACVEEKKLFEIISPLWGNRDPWALGQGLSEAELQKVAWGLGWGLQLNDDQQVTRAFHLGDMSDEKSRDWRAFVAMDFDKKTGIVYFSDSKNGFMLADKIISPVVELEDAAKYMFQKYGFTRNFEDDFEQKEKDRIGIIIGKYCSRMFDAEIVSDMLTKQLITINNNAGAGLLDIKNNNPNLLNKVQSTQWKRFINLILQELKDFKRENNITTTDTSHYERNNQGNILSLRINLPTSNVYEKFIRNLASKNLLPKQNIQQQDNVIYQQNINHFTCKPFSTIP